MESISLTIPERYALNNPHICFQAVNKEETKEPIYNASFVKYAKKIQYEETPETTEETDTTKKKYISEYDRFQEAIDAIRNAFPFDDNMKAIIRKVKEERSHGIYGKQKETS